MSKMLTLSKNRLARFAKTMRAKGYSEEEIRAKLYPQSKKGKKDEPKTASPTN